MKKKITIMLTLILATGTFTPCTAEEKLNNSSYHPRFQLPWVFLYLGKFLRRQEQHQSSGIIPSDLSFNVIADNNKIYVVYFVK